MLILKFVCILVWPVHCHSGGTCSEVLREKHLDTHTARVGGVRHRGEGGNVAERETSEGTQHQVSIRKQSSLMM